MTKKIKVMGLRRSGTNYLNRLLTDNYKIETLDQESLEWWKHGGLTVDTNTADHIMVCVRHPLSWLPSIFRLYNKSYKRTCETGKTFRDLILCPYPNAYSPFINRWVFSTGYWLHKQLFTIPVSVLRYEDILYNPNNYLDKELSLIGEFERSNEEFQLPSNYCAPRSSKAPAKTREDILNYHKQRKFMNYWDMDLLAQANTQMDSSLFETLYGTNNIMTPYEPWNN